MPTGVGDRARLTTAGRRGWELGCGGVGLHPGAPDCQSL